MQDAAFHPLSKYLNPSIFLHKLCLIALISIVTACSSTRSYTKRYELIETAIQQKNYQKAIAKIEQDWKNNKYSEKDKILYYLDIGICYYYADNYEKCIKNLELAERAIEDAYTKSVSRAATSILLNDNVLAYSGEDYEDIYLNIFKALSYLELNKFDDAFVEIRRINEKLQTLSLKYDNLISQLNKSKNAKIKFKKGEIKFHNDALARYLSLLIYRAEEQYDDARIDKEKIEQLWKIQKDLYYFNIPSAVENSLANPKQTKLNVITFVGKGPEKYAVNREIDTYENYIVIKGDKPEKFKDVIQADVKQGYHFRFSLPKIRKRNSVISNIEIYADDKRIGELELLEDMSEIAIATYKVKEQIIYLKSILRTVIKGVVAQKGKEKIRNQIDNPLLAVVTGKVVNAAVDLTENADLRGWRIIPGKCYVGEFVLPDGKHNFTIKYLDSANRLVEKKEIRDVEIKPNKLNLLTTFSYN